MLPPAFLIVAFCLRKWLRMNEVSACCISELSSQRSAVAVELPSVRCLSSIDVSIATVAGVLAPALFGFPDFEGFVDIFYSAVTVENVSKCQCQLFSFTLHR